MRLYEEQMNYEIDASIAKARLSLRRARKVLHETPANDADDTKFQAAYDAVEAVELELQSFLDLKNMNKLSDYGIDIPKEMRADSEHSLLTAVGSAWVTRELRAKKRETIEFWAKLVIPVLALILSIIALVKKSH